MKSFLNPKQLVIFCLTAFICALFPLSAGATSILPACVSNGDCTICDILSTAIQIGVFILGIVGSLVLLMFVYGGFMFLTSGGASDKIKKGKDILVNAVIGLAITFLAYTIVLAFVTAISGGGWTWNASLTCAPITYPNVTGALPTGSSSKEGQDCTTSPTCGTGLFCDATTAKCIKTLASGTKCFGSTIEAKNSLAGDWNKYVTIAAKYTGTIPGIGGLPDLALLLTKTSQFSESNAACQSGNCRYISLSGLESGNNGLGTCGSPEAGSGSTAIGGTCGSSNDCKGGYCSKAEPHKCIAYAQNFGAPCNGLATDEDNRVCGSADEVALCDDVPCEHSTCSDKCVPGNKVGAKGNFCTLSTQCQSQFFCQVKAAGSHEGSCQAKSIAGQPCGDYLLISGDMFFNSAGLVQASNSSTTCVNGLICGSDEKCKTP